MSIFMFLQTWIYILWTKYVPLGSIACESFDYCKKRHLYRVIKFSDPENKITIKRFYYYCKARRIYIYQDSIKIHSLSTASKEYVINDLLSESELNPSTSDVIDQGIVDGLSKYDWHILCQPVS